jgi:hypothetical protein
MFWRRRRQRGQHVLEQGVSTDQRVSAAGHRLSDGDTVPVPGYRTYRAILKEPTHELAPLPPARLRLTPGQEYRAQGHRGSS